MLNRFIGTSGVRPITPRTENQARELLEQAPHIHTIAGARFNELALRGHTDTEFSGLWKGRTLQGLAWHGISFSIIGIMDPATFAYMTDTVAPKRRYASIVGEAPDVAHVWQRVESMMGPARELRLSQPLLHALPQYAVEEPSVSLDAQVRHAHPNEVALVYPASVAMLREEVGTDPERADGGKGYRARVAELVQRRRTYIVRQDDLIVFKADVGALFGGVAQIHGVWTAPEYRGKGIASWAMRQVVQEVQNEHASMVTLYVNSFNMPARRAYAAAGFEQIGELATVLL